MKITAVTLFLVLVFVPGNLMGEDSGRAAAGLEALDQADAALFQIGILKGYLISGSRAGTPLGWSQNGALVKEALKGLKPILPLSETPGEGSETIRSLYDRLEGLFQKPPSSNREFNQGILLAGTLEAAWRREKAGAEGYLAAFFLAEPSEVLSGMAVRSARGIFTEEDRKVMDRKYQAMTSAWLRASGKQKPAGNILTPASAAAEAGWWSGLK